MLHFACPVTARVACARRRRYPCGESSSRARVGHFSWAVPVVVQRAAAPCPRVARGLAHPAGGCIQGRRSGSRRTLAPVYRPPQRHCRRPCRRHGDPGSHARRRPAAARIRLSTGVAARRRRLNSKAFGVRSRADAIKGRLARPGLGGHVARLDGVRALAEPPVEIPFLTCSSELSAECILPACLPACLPAGRHACSANTLARHLLLSLYERWGARQREQEWKSTPNRPSSCCDRKPPNCWPCSTAYAAIPRQRPRCRAMQPSRSARMRHRPVTSLSDALRPLSELGEAHHGRLLMTCCAAYTCDIALHGCPSTRGHCKHS